MPMRISGMSSGMDIDKIVSDLMKVERLPQSKLKQKKDLASFQMDLYREINTKMSAFRESMNAMRYSTNMTGMKGTSSSTDVNVGVSSNLPATSFSVSTNKLAVAAQLSSSAKISTEGFTGSALSASVDITSSNSQMLVTFDGITKAINLTEKTGYTPSELQVELQKQLDTSFGQNKVKVNLTGANELQLDPSAGSNGYKPQIKFIEVNGAVNSLGFTDNQSFRLDLNSSLAASSSKFASGAIVDGEFKVNGVSINYTSSDTLQDVIQRVNSAGTGATMSYDAFNDKIVFKNSATGATQVTLEQVSGNLLSALNFTSGSISSADAIPNAVKGQAAEFTITKADGTSVNVTSNTNQYQISSSMDPELSKLNDLAGINLTLNKVTTAPVSVNVSGDADGIVNKVKSFVTAYNDLIELVNKRLNETKSKGYAPLTEEQRADMEDKDIQLWDEKVKAGLLHDSSLLKDIKNQLREVFTTNVNGVSSEFNALFKVGITTAPYIRGQQQDAGKLIIDETQLRNAIAKDPQAVSQLFTSNPGVESQKGVAVKLYEKSNDFLSSLIKKAGKVGGSTTDITTELGKNVADIQLKILDWNDKLSKKEDVFYKRFSTMESAVAKNNSVLSWLSKQS
ncbi:flagellar filament capping protein FliD [Paenibacillus sp. MMS18-CY102]|uniref:flagellar filament capping protein FliD n=1 Tax=Paenibacillus sp. MMS18-CY102 TaxID=2682849 RepID=UPI0013655A0D|nr:flagellar filament capping protein FliD [Paenibacillus sp. MMS18-CY102]MWC30913.1 flagellar filament capping protein FliD [Paenibacillus sp. MMS18-CY102]